MSSGIAPDIDSNMVDLRSVIRIGIEEQEIACAQAG
jgi:hypothetical protein